MGKGLEKNTATSLFNFRAKNCLRIITKIQIFSSFIKRRDTQGKVLNLQKFKHTLFYHSSICSQQPKGRSNKSVLDGRMDKQNVVHPRDGMLFCLKMEGLSDTCYNTDEPRGHYAK